MIRRWPAAATLLVGTFGAWACTSDGGAQDIAFDQDLSTVPASVTAESNPVATTGDDLNVETLTVRVDASVPGEEISPLILGLSSDLTAAEMRDAGIRLNSWGGNPSTRFNYTIGHAWNNGRDWEFRNTNYGLAGDTARGFLRTSAAVGAETRLAVPTLGWVARNDDDQSCSFPDDEGGCRGDDGSDCEHPDVVADPSVANTESTPAMVADWVAGLVRDGLSPRFIAMDNEPDLWGFTHYDVHPDCPTYEEILEKYLAYATAIREVAPDAELTGPVICCWFDFWDRAPGPADESGEDFLSWFLRQVRTHDEQAGQRTLDVVDVHYYPQSPVFNDQTDAETSALRLRSTRSLWDPDYVDESWIDDRIEFIPRLMRTIDESYPDTPLFISEWNFGADSSMNGALTIAEVLGIYGREGVYAAAYWRSPPAGSPGLFAFKMHGNYDGEGTRFGGRVVSVEFLDPDRLSAFAAVDGATGVLRVMLINEDPGAEIAVDLQIQGFSPDPAGRRFTYGPDNPDEIVGDTFAVDEPVTLPASSITVFELAAGR